MNKIISNAPTKTVDKAEADARAALAAAIADRDDAKRAADDAAAATRRAADMVADADARLRSASEALATARSVSAARLTAAVTNGSPAAPDPALREARARETDAADHLESARAALTSVEAVRDEAAYRLGKAEDRVSDAIRGLVSLSIKDAYCAVEKARVDLDKATAVLFLYSRIVYPWPPTEASWRIERMLDPPQLNLTKDNPRLAPFVAALEALRSDPRAPLPE